MDEKPTIADARAKPHRCWYQRSLRTLLFAVTLVGFLLASTMALYTWAEDFAMKIERDAARERVLKTGDVMKYDRWLLGDEADSIRRGISRSRANIRLRV